MSGSFMCHLIPTLKLVYPYFCSRFCFFSRMTLFFFFILSFLFERIPSSCENCFHSPLLTSSKSITTNLLSLLDTIFHIKFYLCQTINEMFEREFQLSIKTLSKRKLYFTDLNMRHS